jgi:[pyruvate, water dikinase]-phosphate phosphotransferase / [pyruvate, water dikinase] kinase
MPDETPHAIHLVSDGTCRTCEQVVKSVLVQFQGAQFRLMLKPKVLDTATVHAVIDEAAAQHAIVFYTLVAKETRDAIKAAAERRMVPLVDVLGPVLIALYDVFQRSPLATPDMLYKSNKEHYDRVDAVEYTLSHDDGCRSQELDKADVVLVGVSRAAKSTTCFYLAYSGIRAANVPLFPDSEPPAELRKLDPRKVIGLTVNPHRLQSMREARLRGWGMDVSHNYADSVEIARELRAASDQMARYGWRSLDVSYKAIEEVAREIRQMLTESAPTAEKK